MKKLIFSFFMMILSISLYSQEYIITGKLIDSETSNPIAKANLALQGSADVSSELNGTFKIVAKQSGEYILTVQAPGYQNLQLPIQVTKRLLDLGEVYVEREVIAKPQETLVFLTESELENDESNADVISGLLQSTQDVFMRRAAFDFGSVFFKPRGYDSKDATVLINGIPMNKINNGRPQWSDWGGLNDVTRNQELSIGLQPSDYTFGGLFGSNYIDVRPSLNRPGLRLSASASNRSYNGRLMATYNSGVQKSGLSYSLSASRRWAPTQGYVEGTQYNAYSAFGAIEYQFNRENSINVVGIFTPNRRGKSSPLTQEMLDLAGNQYNPMWGYQNGNVRNSRQKIVSEPIFILSYKYNGDQTKANFNVGYQFGTIGNTRIQYSNSQNPEPNYYKNLPSYYLNKKDGADTHLAELQKEYFLANRQLNWNALYNANRQQGSDGRSVFILSNDRTDEQTITGNFNIKNSISENIKWTIGGNYRNIVSENYAQVEDLLGGWYYMNKDYFSGFSYNTLDKDMRKGVKEKINYHYFLRSNLADFFTQFEFNYGKANFYVAARYNYTDYQREGKYKNPAYSDSYGGGTKQIFRGVSTKAGVTYSLTGRHLLQFNTGYFNTPQTVRNTFSNVRNSNILTPGLENEVTYTADASYLLRMPYVKARLTGYYTQIENASETNFFFTQSALTGDISSDFVTQVVEGIQKQHFGMELGAEVEITPTIKATTAVAIGQFTYMNNPKMYLSSDEFERLEFDKVYLKNYHVPNGPQRAYSLGLEYRSPRYWWVAATANYLTHNYISLAPLTRTTNFFKDTNTGNIYPNIDKKLARHLLKQQRLGSVFLVNVIGGKSWRIKGNYLSMFVGINNVFDTSFKSGGFEQSRTANYADMVRDHAQGVPSFGPRYFVGYGRTYFVNLALSL